MSANGPAVRDATADDQRLAVANVWLSRAARERGIAREQATTEVDRRRKAKGCAHHAAVLEVFLDLSLNLWSP